MKKLDLIRFNTVIYGYPRLELNLLMLQSIQPNCVAGIGALILNAPRLRRVNFLKCHDCLFLKIFRTDFVEKLAIYELRQMEVNKLKNLRYLYCAKFSIIPSTLLANLEQLEEIHLNHHSNVARLFEQKQLYDRVDLKIYLFGLLLNSSEDRVIGSFNYDFHVQMVHLDTNPTRLAVEIPFWNEVTFSEMDVPQASEINLLKRLVDLDTINVYHPVKNIERFLNLLKNLNNIAKLAFWGDQPQTLFNRLPNYCAVQRLKIYYGGPIDLRFLNDLTNLTHLEVACLIDVEFIRKVFGDLKFLSEFNFKYLTSWVAIKVEHHPKHFNLTIGKKNENLADLDNAIEFIFASISE